MVADIKDSTVFVSYSAQTVEELVVEHRISILFYKYGEHIGIPRQQRADHCMSVPIH